MSQILLHLFLWKSRLSFYKYNLCKSAGRSLHWVSWMHSYTAFASNPQSRFRKTKWLISLCELFIINEQSPYSNHLHLLIWQFINDTIPWHASDATGAAWKAWEVLGGWGGLSRKQYIALHCQSYGKSRFSFKNLKTFEYSYFQCFGFSLLCDVFFYWAPPPFLCNLIFLIWLQFPEFLWQLILSLILMIA